MVADERLKMLRWHHLQVELDDREKQWPKGSSYEFDYDNQTVVWSFGGKQLAPGRFVWHLTDDDLSEPKPSQLAEVIIKRANFVADEDDQQS